MDVLVMLAALAAAPPGWQDVSLDAEDAQAIRKELLELRAERRRLKAKEVIAMQEEAEWVRRLGWTKEREREGTPPVLADAQTRLAEVREQIRHKDALEDVLVAELRRLTGR